jgi:hypothetical protein
MNENHIHVYYPSGKNFSIAGEWVGCCFSGGLQLILVRNPRITDPAMRGVLAKMTRNNTDLVLDPRCCCVDKETGAVLYNPREHGNCTEPWVKKWLIEHPEWPGTLEL